MSRMNGLLDVHENDGRSTRRRVGLVCPSWVFVAGTDRRAKSLGQCTFSISRSQGTLVLSHNWAVPSERWKISGFWYPNLADFEQIYIVPTKSIFLTPRLHCHQTSKPIWKPQRYVNFSNKINDILMWLKALGILEIRGAHNATIL